ncbi:MAG TPA: FAD-binding dehydrogenase, partial [Marinobacter hydrocarbonoclasticus]|nr:FAD-binding dehydrogenase [Marinobacter nauticus]
MVKPVSSDLLIAGGGLAGIVTALEALRAGKSVTIVDRDSPERFGGLALWAFGGMMLIDTPLQRRMKIADSPELALNDWLRFGELDPNDEWPMQWARYYVEHSRTDVHDWLANEGIKFMPAVNWVERGRFGDGNSVPRYHITWGTSRELVRCMVNALHEADTGGRLAIHHRHRITALDHQAGEVCGAVAINEETREEVRFEAPNVVLAMGGINGSHAECRANWPKHRPQPATML